jgi:hypothetical protein
MNPYRYDWTIPSKAVIACDGTGQGCVLYTVGAHVAMDLREIGRGLDDIGLDDAPAGISIWEGKTTADYYLGLGSYDSEPATQLEGAFRTPTDEEWVAIRAGRCPWDEAAWLLPEAPEHTDEDQTDEPA